MTTINAYINDGANWQAQCVLAYLRSHLDLPEHYGLFVGRYENCREQGYIFTLTKHFTQILHIAVYEHRNVDNLVVKSFRGQFINTPRAEDLGMTDKYDYDKDFAYGKIVECGKYVLDTINYEIENLKTIIEKTRQDYNELKAIVDDYQGTWDELYEELKGHNKDVDLFDVNFKDITATIFREPDGSITLGKNFDAWSLNAISPNYEQVNIDSLYI